MTDERKNGQAKQTELPSYPFDKHNKAYGAFLPFIFVSYCHENYDSVLPFLEVMSHRRYRFWYDNGLHGGDHWKDRVYASIDAADIVVLLLSKNYLSDSHYVCKEEMDYAFEQESRSFPFDWKRLTYGTKS